ncbi:hypothetical protein C8J57DRAFT_1228397 [Mycena rebaudengoi]|nr:hypothetical protein C8J57DRAFT_1228397 [Mycena rebaudengoi]
MVLEPEAPRYFSINTLTEPIALYHKTCNLRVAGCWDGPIRKISSNLNLTEPNVSGVNFCGHHGQFDNIRFSGANTTFFFTSVPPKCYTDLHLNLASKVGEDNLAPLTVRTQFEVTEMAECSRFNGWPNRTQGSGTAFRAKGPEPEPNRTVPPLYLLHHVDFLFLALQTISRRFERLAVQCTMSEAV